MDTDARSRIDAERDEVDRRIRSLRTRFEAIVAGSEFTTDDDEHDPEGSTIAFERAQVSALLAAATAERDELAEASTRLDRGTYGRCERCGEPIAPMRLDALPATRRCIECSVRVDR